MSIKIIYQGQTEKAPQCTDFIEFYDKVAEMFNIPFNEEIKEYSNLGADAFLIGESLMKEQDLTSATKRILGIEN